MRRLFRIISSRYLICVLLILAELCGLVYVIAELSAYSIYFTLVATVINYAVLIYVINTDANPEYKLSWVCVILLVPIIGAVMFILFYRRKLGKGEIKRALTVRASLLPLPNSCDGALNELAELSPRAAGKALAVVGNDEMTSVYRGTASRYFGSGEDMYLSMLEDIRKAEHYIFLEYFIIADGEMWNGIYRELLTKVQNGVEVRLLYDDIGCMGTLPLHFDRQLQRVGIQARRFSKLTGRANTVHNNRDHRKILVVDGRICYTGGINIADEYINKKSRFGHWKDGGVRLEGEAAQGFARLFLLMWGFTVGRSEDCDEYFRHGCSVSDGGYYLPFGSGPYPLYKQQIGKRAIIDIINQAKQYVYITTPYLIIDFDLTEAMVGACMRGIDVRIITPAVADKKLIKLMTKSAYPHLMEAGVGIYEYTPGFIHEKLIVADDEYAIIGTINMDYRSLVHHFEDAVWMYRSPTVVRVREEFMETLSKSKKLNEADAKLNIIERGIRGLVRLFAPLM